MIKQRSQHCSTAALQLGTCGLSIDGCSITQKKPIKAVIAHPETRSTLEMTAKLAHILSSQGMSGQPNPFFATT
jgi:hypothetical protein